MLKQLFTRKSIAESIGSHQLYRSLTTLDLTLMGIGAIIGAGIFVLTGIVASTKAGPAVVVSYLIAGFAAMLAALAYAELAASIGGAGSAYSYAYAGFGELIAWIIGWNLLLEYIASVATVAIGWSGYVSNLLSAIGIALPDYLTHSPFHPGGLINLPAVLIILLLALMLCFDVKQSARFNATIVFIKLLTITFFILIAVFNIRPEYWTPFVPFGWPGVVEGAALVFFAYIGFDALSTAVEEAIEPQRAVPIAIISSLFICTVLYIVVAALLTGIVPYQLLDQQSPVADALLKLGYRLAGGIIAAGAIAGLTSVMLIMFYGASRIFLAMTRDGLLPLRLAKIHPATGSPVIVVLLIGTVMALLAGFMPIEQAASLVNLGTLSAFAFVCGGVVVFRYTHPNLARPFKLPLNPLLPFLGVLICFYLMMHLSAYTWWRFLLWTVAGLVLYCLYGIHHSVLRRSNIK